MERGLISVSSFRVETNILSYSREKYPPAFRRSRRGLLFFFFARSELKKLHLHVLERRELDTCEEIGVEEVWNAVNCARERV